VGARANTERQARIAKWYAADARRSIPQAARLFKVRYETVVAALAAQGVERRPDPSKTAYADRDCLIVQQVTEFDRSLAAVGREYHVSRQRVHQIVSRARAEA
jgi:hypothetical protein